MPVKQLCYVKKLLKLQCMFFVLQCFMDEIFQFVFITKQTTVKYNLFALCNKNVKNFCCATKRL